MNNLLMFVGTDCPHCEAMQPLVARLAFDTGLEIDRRDIWTSERDARLAENYRSQIADAEERDACDGIPFFYNTKTGQHLCGEVSYTDLKAWAVAENMA